MEPFLQFVLSSAIAVTVQLVVQEKYYLASQMFFQPFLLHALLVCQVKRSALRKHPSFRPFFNATLNLDYAAEGY